MLKLSFKLTPYAIIINPNGIRNGQCPFSIQIDEPLFIQIYEEVLNLLQYRFVARYYYIKEENVGLFFGIDRVKIKGKITDYHYIRVEYYTDIEILNDTSTILSSGKEIKRQNKYAMDVIEGEVDFLRMMHETREDYEELIDSHMYLRENVVNEGEDKVDVAKLTRSTRKYSNNNPQMTQEDRRKFKNDNGEIN